MWYTLHKRSTPALEAIVLPPTTTLDEFIAMNPGQRLRFGQNLGDRITPEIFTYLIHTYLSTEMHTQTRKIYSQALRALIAKVDPIALLVLAYRHINTSTAPPSLLPSHQEFFSVMAGLMRSQSLNFGYIRRQVVNRTTEYFTGTLSRRILPSNLAGLLAAGFHPDDGVLYNPEAIRWRNNYTRGTVEMIRVPLDNNLPDTLGLKSQPTP
jgi:hypothetical protein